MGYMSMRELNANVSKAMAEAEAGEDIILTRNGKPVLRVTRESVPNDEKRAVAAAQLVALMERGIVGLHGPATYDERTGR